MDHFKMEVDGQQSAAIDFLRSVVETSGAATGNDVTIGDATLPTLDSATEHVLNSTAPPHPVVDDWEKLDIASGTGSPSSAISYASARQAPVLPGFFHQYSPFLSAPPPQQNQYTQTMPWPVSYPQVASPKLVMLAPETSELLKTAISSDLQVKLNIQLSTIQQSIVSEVREECRKLLHEIKEEVRTLKRRKRG